MLALVVSILVAVPAPSVSASITCAQEPASCDAAVDLLAVAGGPAAGPMRVDYATPAVIDCRVPVVAPALLSLVGECDGATQLASRAVAAGWLIDASYRASRYPESERPSGTLGPRRRDTRPPRDLTTCTGGSTEGGTALSTATGQPLALFAAPRLPHFESTSLGPASARLPPSRSLYPLERPPRA